MSVARTGGNEQQEADGVGEEARDDEEDAGDDDQRAVRERAGGIAAGIEARLQAPEGLQALARAPARPRPSAREDESASVGSTPMAPPTMMKVAISAIGIPMKSNSSQNATVASLASGSSNGLPAPESLHRERTIGRHLPRSEK